MGVIFGLRVYYRDTGKKWKPTQHIKSMGGGGISKQKENGNRCSMWGSIGIMEKNMETTIAPLEIIIKGWPAGVAVWRLRCSILVSKAYRLGPKVWRLSPGHRAPTYDWYLYLKPSYRHIRGPRRLIDE